LRWNPPSGAVEMATVTNVPVLLFKLRCMFFFTVKTFLCALSRESTLSFSSLSANPLLWRPLLFHMPLPSQTVFGLISQRHSRLCNFISDIMDYFWLAKTSNKPIILTTWLAINPLTCNLRILHSESAPPTGVRVTNPSRVSGTGGGICMACILCIVYYLT